MECVFEVAERRADDGPRSESRRLRPAQDPSRVPKAAFDSLAAVGALVAAGLTPYQALHTGTVDVAKFLGEEGGSGVVRVGARADLLLLDANPLTSIANSLRINGVVVNGRWIGPVERERMLGSLRSQ